jgi:SET domain-containing protein
VFRVGESPGRGRGIFATVDIPEGTVIEECPVIVIPLEEVETINQTVLRDYHFMWGGTGEASAVCLGHGSLYNHDHTPNAMYVRRLDARIIAFHALRDIRAGEEITVSYNGGWGDRTPVWFEKRP